MHGKYLEKFNHIRYNTEEHGQKRENLEDSCKSMTFKENGMNGSDVDLKAIWQQTAEKKRLEAKLRELHAQQETLETRTEELERTKLDEQADVDRLEGRSLAAFFYNVVGKLDQKLDKERQEAYAAQMKYDTAAWELAAVQADIARCEEQTDRLKGCEERYRAALKEKAAAIRRSGSDTARRLLEAESKAFALESRMKEVMEAVDAGNTALHTAERALETLESAESLSTWDVLGGGLLVDLAKYDDLDKAQAQVEQLQEDLRRFKIELTDVTVEAELQVSIDGFLQFADFFFDGLFADLAVMDHIHESQEKVRRTWSEIQDVLSRLADMQVETEKELDAEQERIAQITVDAVLS